MVVTHWIKYLLVNLIRQMCKISPITMGLSISVCVCYFVHTSHTLAKIKNVKNEVGTFLHLPANGIIVKIVLCDLDLHFRF